MIGSLAVFKFVAKAALNAAGLGIAGDVVAEALPEMAKEVYERWVRGRPPAAVRAEARALARLSDEEAHQLALQAVGEVAGGAAPDIHLSLITYLAQVPAAVRRTRRSPTGPSGRTVPPGLVLAGPADVMALLPARSARFRKGERAPGFPDWELQELLGIGGFGEVWLATNRHLPPAALKFCLDPATARFLRHEADLLGRVVARGRHPGIVALLDTALTTDPPCLKYEYVPGGDLAGLIEGWHRGRRDAVAGLALPRLRELAAALAFAHRLSPPIVHRDLKPANVLVQAGGRTSALLKVADFGIGAVVSARGFGTLAGTRASVMPTALRGSCTPLYASPEQMRGEPPSPRDDVYALGVIGYQMLTGALGERPGSDWREVLAEAGASEGLLDALGRCLAGRAERRWADAGELLAALDGLGPEAPRTMLMAEPPEEEKGDSPLDLARQVARSLERAQKALADAVRLSEERHDYAGAVRALEGVPEALRDNGLLEALRERRDRVEALRAEVQQAVRLRRYAGLRDRIGELLELVPDDKEIRRLHQAVPWQPGLMVTNAVGMRLVLVPAGEVVMGAAAGEFGQAKSEAPAHRVEVTQPFYLGAYPVTQEEYRRVTGESPSHFRAVPGCDTRLFPVESVSWPEAVAFCAALSRLPEERAHKRRYRLPTEAEWEHACRAGGEPGLPFAHGRSLTGRDANFDGNHPYGGGRGEFLRRTCEVGSYAANARGLYDMHGQVWEWCQDWYADDYYRRSPRRDPTGPERGEAKVLRGGSWQNHGRLCRSASREWLPVGYRGLAAGVRVVLEVG